MTDIAPHFHSSVLSVGQRIPEIEEFGADRVATLAEAKEIVAKSEYPVLALSTDKESLEHIIVFLLQFQARSPNAQIILVGNTRTAEDLKRVTNDVRIFKVLRYAGGPEIGSTLREALAEHQLIRQNAELLVMLREQNLALENLQTQLEKRVQQRQTALTRAHGNLIQANRKLETVHQSLVSVERARSIGEIETSLKETLRTPLGMEFIRIRLKGHPTSPNIRDLERRSDDVFVASLVHNSALLGEIVFGRPGRAFLRDEREYLGEIVETVTLATSRLATLRQAEEIKMQWEATFNSITFPVALISDTFEILSCNQAFADCSGHSRHELPGTRCYESLFHRSKPCESCHMGKDFQVPRPEGPHDKRIFSVKSHRLWQEKTQITYVHIYLNETKRIEMERQLLENATAAELGTIGGSIAHELNNPLAGIITFLQLIKMDAKPSDFFLPDLQEMEEAAQRCKHIVERVLDFSRKPSESAPESSEVFAALTKAAEIVEIQARSLGISIDFSQKENQILFPGNTNLLAQAFVNVLQFLINHICEKMARQPGFSSGISIRTSVMESRIFVTFSQENEKGAIETPTSRQKTDTDLSATPGLNLTSASKILTEVGARVEQSASTNDELVVRISVPSLVFPPIGPNL